MEAPICLVENRENGKLVVNPEAIDILSKINEPAVVVSVIGMYRTGKSYLMNKLAGVSKGFSLGSTIQSKTKGIWMWCVPHPINNDNILVLLDTEGLGDVEKGDKNNDILIFTLTILLSSAMVYNSKGTIDQDALNKLKLVGELTELIKVNLKDNEDEEAEFSRHFPIFIWAVRDFQLQLNIGGKSVSGDEYLENALKLKKPEKTLKDEEFNKVRKRLRMYFGNRRCFIFDLPTAERELLHKLEDVPDSHLNENFVAQIQKFCDYIYNNADVKRVKDTIRVTGARLGELTKMYTEALNSAKFACMEEAAVSLSEKENQFAVQEAVRHYEDKMREASLPTDTLNQFLALSGQYEEEARQIFLQRSLRDKDQRFLKEFVENIQKKKDEFSFMNEEESRKICVTLIRKLFAELEKSLAEGMYYMPGGYGKYKQDLKCSEIKYNIETGKGLKAEEVLQGYLKSKEETESIILQQDNALTLQQKEIEEVNARRAMEEMENKIREMEKEQNVKKLEEEKDNLKKTIQQLIMKMEEEKRIMKETLEKEMRKKDQERALYEQQGLEQQARMYQTQIDDLRKTVEEQNNSKMLDTILNLFSRLNRKQKQNVNDMSFL